MAGTTFTWTATTASAWTIPGNWSPVGTPGAGDTAIDLAGTIQVNGGTVAAADLSIGGSLTAPSPGKGTISATAGAEVLISDAIAVWSGSTLSVDATSSIDIGPSGTVVAGDIDIESGHTLQGDGLVQASVVNNGTIDALGTVAGIGPAGTLEITGSVTGVGMINLGPNSAAKLDGPVATGQAINFSSGGSELFLGSPGTGFSAPITNLNTGDRIEFNFGPGVTISKASVTSPGTVTVVITAGNYVLSNVGFAAGSAQQFFSFTDSATGFAGIVVAPPSYGWTGKISTDLGTAGNWQNFTTAQNPAANPPDPTISVSFTNSNAGATNTLTGSASAIGFNFFGPGAWLLSGASLNVAGTPNAPFLPFGGSFNTNVTLDATTLAIGGTTNIGASTGANVTAQNGSHVSTEGDTIGGQAGQTGSLTVTGVATTWTEQIGAPVNGSLPGFLTVGSSGLGVLNVNGGGAVNPGSNFVVGNNAGGSGTVTIGAGSAIDVGGSFAAVGNNAGSNGSMVIGSGGTLDFTLAAQTNSAVLSIGRAAAAGSLTEAVGSVNVTGTGALLNTNDNPLDVGRSGLGSLTVAQGGSVAVGTPDSNLLYGLSIAYSGGTGSVTVTDPGSTFALTGFGFDGRGGHGTLTIENFGSFVVNDAPASGGGFNIGVGRGAGPTAPTNVGGTGTALVTSNGLLEINSSTSGLGVGGNGASGVLNVNNNGTILAGTGVTIGTATSAGGTIYGGSGTLNIGTNGLVRVSNPTLTGNAIVVGGANSSIGGPTNADSGAVFVSGTNALLDGNGAGIVVGLLSPGSLEISQGGKVVSGTPNNATFAAVGVGREANGSIKITDTGSSETANGFFYVGRGAAGTLTVENHGSLNVGVDGLGSGNLNIGGAGLANGSTLIVGGSGTGLVTTNGDAFSQQNVVVGENGTDGALTVDSGGTVEAGRQLLLGRSITLAAGDMIVSPSGTTTVASPTVVSANGHITVGTNGVLKADGTGAAAGQPSIIVGDGTGSTGTLAVSGAGAMVDSAGDLSIGQNPGGTGDVSISAGGQIEVGGNLVVWQGSTVSVLDCTSGIDVGTSLAPQSGDILVEAGHELYGDGVVNAVLLNNGTVIATNSGTLSASTGGKLELIGSVSGTGTAELASSSTLALDSTLGTGQTIVFNTGSAETLILGQPGSSLSNTLINVGLGNRIELGGGISITAVNMLNTHTAEVLFGLGGTYDITNINFAAGASQFSFGHDAVSGDDFIQAVCFARGTFIATPRGEARVEELTVGDMVLTKDGAVEPIIWIGVGRVLVTPGRRSAATPVIVRKGALGDNVPNRDLRVTKGHSLHIDEALIPVEFLVNHRSILWDDRAREIEIFHIELPRHGVLIANGAPAESYRDDGNRWLFQNANPGWTLPPQAPCAPLLTGGPIVDDIWWRLLDRAGPRKGAPLTDDPDLHLLIDGKRIDAIERNAERYAFRLPTRPRTVRIRSRSAVPQELGVARDARSLGVALRRIVLAQPRRQQALDADAPALVDGWHTFEPDNGIRWTDGDAALPAALFAAMNGRAMLILHVGPPTSYVDDGGIERAA